MGFDGAWRLVRKRWGRARKVRSIFEYLGEETSFWVHLGLIVNGKQVMP